MNSFAIELMLDESATAALLLNAEGLVLRMNKAGTEMFGILDENPPHVSYFLALHPRNDSTIDDVYWWELIQAQLRENDKPQKFKGVAQCPNEMEFPVKATFVSLGETDPYNYCLYVFRRIKSVSQQVQRSNSIASEAGSVERRTREEEAFNRAEYMEHAVNEALDPVFIIDHYGKILLSNKAATEKFGWSSEEFMKGNISMIAAGVHGKLHDDYLKRYMNTGEKRVIGKKRTLSAVRKDGSEFPIELGVTEVIQSESTGKRIFCGYVHDITESKRAALELEAKQEMALALIDASSEPMFQINERGRIQMVNHAATRVFGWTREEFLKGNISMIAGGIHSERHDQYLKNYLNTGIAKAIGKKRELQAKRKDGTEVPIQLGISEVCTKGGERLFCGFVRVLTKEKMQERELIHRSALLDGMIDSAFDPMFQIDQNGIIQMANSAAVDLFGWSRENFVGKNISMIMPQNHGHNHNLYMSNYFKSGEKRVIGKNRQLMARKRDGTEFPIQLGVKEVKAPWGESFFCGFLKDMTSAVADKERLSRKEALTVGMINSAFDPMFLINCFGIIHMVNDAACDSFGWAREELLGSNISMICGGVHGEQGRHNEYLRSYLENGGKKVIGRRRQLTAKRKDGTEFPIELGVSEVTTVWNERFFCGFVRDIRRQKYDEVEMHERQKLNFAVIQASTDALFAVDEHMTVYLANSAACRLLGYSSEELRYMDLKNVLSTSEPKKLQRLEKFLSLNSTATFCEKIECHRKQGGATFTVDMMITEVGGPFEMLLSPGNSQRPDGTRFFSVNFHSVNPQRGLGDNVATFIQNHALRYVGGPQGLDGPVRQLRVDGEGGSTSSLCPKL